jgi:hypothetical protein
MVLDSECGNSGSDPSQKIILDCKVRPAVTREDSEAFSEGTTPWYESDDEDEEEDDMNSLDINTIRQRLLCDSSFNSSPCSSWRNSKVKFSDTDDIHLYEPPAPECHNDLYYHSEEMQEFLETYLHEQQQRTQRVEEGSASVEQSGCMCNMDSASSSPQNSSIAQ